MVLTHLVWALIFFVSLTKRSPFRLLGLTKWKMGLPKSLRHVEHIDDLIYRMQVR